LITPTVSYIAKIVILSNPTTKHIIQYFKRDILVADKDRNSHRIMFTKPEENKGPEG